jgi:hypothetical protein
MKIKTRKRKPARRAHKKKTAGYATRLEGINACPTLGKWIDYKVKFTVTPPPNPNLIQELRDRLGKSIDSLAESTLLPEITEAQAMVMPQSTAAWLIKVSPALDEYVKWRECRVACRISQQAVDLLDVISDERIRKEMKRVVRERYEIFIRQMGKNGIPEGYELKNTEAV